MSLVKKISEGFHWAAAIIIAFTFILILADIITRDFKICTILGVLEITGFLCVWLTLIGMPYAFRQGRQIRVDLVTSHVSPKIRYILRLATNVVVVVFCIAIFSQSIAMISDTFVTHQTTQLLRLPLWAWEICVPLGMLFLALEAAFEVFSMVKSGVPAKTAAGSAEAKGKVS